MGIDPARSRWGLPDVLLGVLAFLLGGFVTVVATMAIGSLATASDGSFARGNTGLLGIIGLLGSWGAVVGYLKLIVWLKGGGSLRLDFGFRFTWWDPLIGAGAAFVTLILSGVVQQLVSLATGTVPEGNSEAIFGDVRTNQVLLVAMGLMASIGAPIVEELLFRGLALRAIEKRLGGVVGVLGSSLLFGAMHYQPELASPLGLIAGITVFGLVFAVVTRWSRRLGPAVFAHIWLNSLATAVVLIPALF
jgi:membrane protease YdiL (CAAX protease family)